MSKKRALLSVSDKTGVVELANALHTAGYQLISTGGTATLLTENGLEVTPIEDVTGFPECMDGRLKTLHPAIFGGILAVQDNAQHMQTMTEQGIGTIDVVVVNLYPFRATVEKPDHTLPEAIEQIDIGGPSMIRGAAKNYKYVTVVVDPGEYSNLIQHIQGNTLDENYRLQLALQAFSHTAAYDAYIAEYLRQAIGPNKFPSTLTLTLDKHPTPIRYGENPHQQGAYYSWPQQQYHGIEGTQLLQGKPLSYNNIADAHAALALTREFDSNQEAVCVAVKHATPCGVATGESTLDAYIAAYTCDPQSIFGGIVCFNREVDGPTALKMKEIFLDVIIAPGFSDEAQKVLGAKKNLRLLALGQKQNSTTPLLWEMKSVGGGVLIQEADSGCIETETHNVVTKKQPENMKDLIFAMKVVKHVKSNAIVVVKNGCTLGLGGGDVSRVWAAQAALDRAGDRAKGAVMASDALLPFDDVVKLCAQHGITEIIQPGGSVNDQLSIDVADSHGIAMVFTGVRHFKH